MRLARAMLVLGALSLASCVTVRPRAEAVVDVDADPGIRADTAAISVLVRGGPTGGPLELSISETLRAPLTFPVRLTILPRDEDVSRVFEVTIVAVGADLQTIGRLSMRGRFVAGQTTVTRLVLEDCCRTVARTCAEGETCSACECVPPIVVSPDDAGVSADVSIDTATDAGQTGDRDAGPIACSVAEECPFEACADVACVGGACTYTTRCGAGQVCCGTECAAAADCTCDGRGGPRETCRPASGPCDQPEQCSAFSRVCPPDLPAGMGTSCRPSTGDCDVGEKCDGASFTCPGDVFLPPATPCAAGSGTCNGLGACQVGCVPGTACLPADPCGTGTIDCATGSPVCVATGRAAAGTLCRASMGVCDVAEVCDGMSTACPADAFATSAQVCRFASGACDAEERCTGTTATCPADGFSVGTICRSMAGPCDVAETCNGASSACPADGFQSGEACGLTVECVERSVCDGASAACPPGAPTTAGESCGRACNACDGEGHCAAACVFGQFCCPGIGCVSNDGPLPVCGPEV